MRSERSKKRSRPIANTENQTGDHLYSVVAVGGSRTWRYYIARAISDRRLMRSDIGGCVENQREML
jgi:hypothetical protein